MPLFTPLNAKEMAFRSVASRRAAEAERKAKLAAMTAPAGQPTELDPAQSLSRVRVHMDRLHELMSKAKTDREWDNLSRSYERIFKIWMVLSQTPGPGQRKPLPEAPRRRPEIPRLYPQAPWQPAISPDA